MKGLGNAEILGRNLRRYVDQSGKLGKDIAAIVGVSPATFSEWMNGKKYPRIDKIELLANYFHIQKSDLIEEHPGEKQNSGSINGLAPKTLEARIVSFGMDSLPKEEREKILSILQTMYNNNPDLFKEESTNDA